MATGIYGRPGLRRFDQPFPYARPYIKTLHFGIPYESVEPVFEALGSRVHPINIHEVTFDVVDRQSLETGATRGPEPWETGRKDTVIGYPAEIARVKATYDRAGLFVWHCHIVAHEDHQMMRPYRIGP
jgi:FtsP/CotA-like multicopper oxidase with cupredoxin domain